MIDRKGNIFHDLSGESSTESAKIKVRQVKMSTNRQLRLTNCLMPVIASKSNLKKAFKSVKRNKGAAGIDKVSVKDINDKLDYYLDQISTQLSNGDYSPMPVRAVNIPKPNGGTRGLGIPTVIDRIVQQSIVIALTPIFDPTFSKYSFGFRPNRSAKMAIKQAKDYVKQGRIWTVDMDLEKFFDKVNHDKLMGLLRKTIQDIEVIKIIRKFLTAGVMDNGVVKKKEQGTPQGGPLSPLLSNIMLHELDKELEKREHKFCRYADDCNIYVQSERSAERVLRSITNFIEKRLKLKVNTTKSAFDKTRNRKFLGFTINSEGDVAIATQPIQKFKDTIRKLTKRNRGISLQQVISELNRVMRGWFHYFKESSFQNIFKQLDGWIRRKLRCFRIKQRKRKYAIKTFLETMGIDQQQCWALACSEKGWWRKSLNPVAHRAMPKQWFLKMGLFCLHERFVLYQTETAVCDNARTVV